MAQQKQLQPTSNGDLLPANIHGQARELLQQMFSGWTARNVGAKRMQEDTVRASIRVLASFFNHAGKIPGQLARDDFDKWALSLARERQIKTHTQRHYYSHVRGFLAYLLSNTDLRNSARRLFGSDIIQLVDKDSDIPHRLTHEAGKDAKVGPLTHAQIEQFFATLDECIAYQHAHGTRKSLLCLLRDKALFSLMYAAGLRISEASGLNVTSFEPEPRFPEFGQFGNVRVFGKGGKWRTVPIMLPETVQLLSAYASSIRPLLKGFKGDPNERAFFLTERGTHISASAVYNRFGNVLKEQGLQGTGLHPHQLRHSSVTHHGLGGLEIDSLRGFAGHTFAATTQGYFNPPSEFIADDYTRATRRIMDNAE